MKSWTAAIVGSLVCVAIPLCADDNKDAPRAPDKSSAVVKVTPTESAGAFLRPASSGKAIRTEAKTGERSFPLVVVRGTPYEMGRQLGEAMKLEIQSFVPAALAGITAEMKVSVDELRDVWARTAAYADDRVEQELLGLADGAGLPLSTLQALHAVPLLMPYSCSSIAAWGAATEDGHLYQSRNLDWNLEIGAHDVPVIVVYVPDAGIPHVVPTFAGVIGAHTGMNAKGIALAEMGDASGKEAPYFVHAPHFTVFFRTMLYDCENLSKTIDLFRSLPMTKRYHFVFGDGKSENRAVKILAHSPEPKGKQLAIWSDNDSTDEFAPNVLSCMVYNDEGRGAFPSLQRESGKLNGEKLVAIANSIPIKGGNVVNVVYDATASRMWVSYAHGKKEAFELPYVFVDLKPLFAP